MRIPQYLRAEFIFSTAIHSTTRGIYGGAWTRSSSRTAGFGGTLSAACPAMGRRRVLLLLLLLPLLVLGFLLPQMLRASGVSPTALSSATRGMQVVGGLLLIASGVWFALWPNVLRYPPDHRGPRIHRQGAWGVAVALTGLNAVLAGLGVWNLLPEWWGVVLITILVIGQVGLMIVAWIPSRPGAPVPPNQ